jgi:hypothetical protein
MNKKALFYNMFVLITVLVTLSYVVIWDTFSSGEIQRDVINSPVASILEAQARLASHNDLVRRSLSKSAYDSFFRLASNGGVIGQGPFGRYQDVNIVNWKTNIGSDLVEESFVWLTNHTLLGWLNKSFHFLPTLKEDKPPEYSLGKESGLYISVKFPQDHYVPVPVPPSKIFSEENSRVKSQAVGSENSQTSHSLPSIFCGFTEKCNYFVEEDDLNKLKTIYWLYARYGILLRREMFSIDGSDYLCFSKKLPLEGLTFGEAQDKLHTLLESFNQKVKEGYGCVELSKPEGPMHGSFYTDPEFFSGVVRKPLAAYKYFDYNYFERLKDFQFIISELETCIKDKISATSNEDDIFYSKNYLTECLKSKNAGFEEKDFSVFDYSVVASTQPDEGRLYNLSDTYYMMEESNDRECVGPDTLTPLIESFTNPNAVFINSTHFTIETEEDKGVDVAAQKLDGFSGADSPIITQEICVTDLLGEPVFPQLSLTKKISLQEILTLSSVDITDTVGITDFTDLTGLTDTDSNNYINWYKTSEGRVCIVPTRFSKASLIKLARMYFETFYEEELGEVADTFFPGLGTLIDVVGLIEEVKDLDEGESLEGDFCSFLENKNFENVNMAFPECLDKTEKSFTNFRSNLNKLEKQKCSVAKRWYTIGAFDKSLDYPTILSEESFTFSNPLFLGSFFVG